MSARNSSYLNSNSQSGLSKGCLLETGMMGCTRGSGIRWDIAQATDLSRKLKEHVSFFSKNGGQLTAANFATRGAIQSLTLRAEQ
jgi:hypothetical protein